MSPRSRRGSFLAAVAAGIVGACGAFGDGTKGEELTAADGGGSTPDADASSADARGPETGVSTAPIRCGEIACAAGTKCCLPLENDSPKCVDRLAVCGSAFGELLCSSRAGCSGSDVCCVSAERNPGQTAFDITRSYCVATSACPDANLQRSLCDLGEGAQCPGQACKPYLRDTNGGQDLDVNPLGYATCQ